MLASFFINALQSKASTRCSRGGAVDKQGNEDVLADHDADLQVSSYWLLLAMMMKKVKWSLKERHRQMYLVTA